MDITPEDFEELKKNLRKQKEYREEIKHDKKKEAFHKGFLESFNRVIDKLDYFDLKRKYLK